MSCGIRGHHRINYNQALVNKSALTYLKTKQFFFRLLSSILTIASLHHCPSLFPCLTVEKSQRTLSKRQQRNRDGVVEQWFFWPTTLSSPPSISPHLFAVIQAPVTVNRTRDQRFPELLKIGDKF
ncbi:hypothetical protein CFOL_v3_34693 [Cephalotus follicularis]|uniref:Uncharacterized protein n=1 Tax=Cephalotus follicularis TaxID=3775 RepID=A0A1Q3DFI3_CEPFO|nr:hypothetical protein CFOL_v3_34693 [Cephalotus follicularis]